MLAGWKARSRKVFACLAAAFVPLLPVVTASGPQQRYLYLVAPWMVLAAVAAAVEVGLPVRIRRVASWLALVVVGIMLRVAARARRGSE